MPGVVNTNIFTDSEVSILRSVAHKVIGLAVEDGAGGVTLEKLAHFMYPLYSQDSSLVSFGFDLEEYMEWYFTDPDIDVRRARPGAGIGLA